MIKILLLSVIQTSDSEQFIKNVFNAEPKIILNINKNIERRHWQVRKEIDKQMITINDKHKKTKYRLHFEWVSAWLKDWLSLWVSKEQTSS